jgi:hypothetical protein
MGGVAATDAGLVSFHAAKFNPMQAAADAGK